MVAALVLGGCGGGHHQRAAKSTGPAPTLALADCGQWHEMRQSTRHGFVTQLNIFFGAKADNGEIGQTLTDDQAFTVITNGCKPAWARNLKLYKLYGRAAAFTP